MSASHISDHAVVFCFAGIFLGRISLQPFARCKLTPHEIQKNCPKHVEFYSKNEFEKLVHLVGFFIRIYHDAGHAVD